MNITRQSDYAIRCILYLASKQDGGAVMVEEISRAMDIPKSFLAKILQKLTKAGIVNSIRGIKGGFVLKRNVDKINLLEVIQLIEGPISINRCAVDRQYCGRSCVCTVHPVWLGLRDTIQDYLSSITFDRLIGNKAIKGSFGTIKKTTGRRRS